MINKEQILRLIHKCNTIRSKTELVFRDERGDEYRLAFIFTDGTSVPGLETKTIISLDRDTVFTSGNFNDLKLFRKAVNERFEEIQILKRYEERDKYYKKLKHLGINP